MSESNDWEPLSQDQRTLHPGELVALPPRPAPAPVGKAPAPAARAPKPPATMAAARRAAPARPDPAAEGALRALQQRLAKAPPAKSLVAEVQRREDRAGRKQLAARAPFAAAVAPVRLDAQSAPPPPAPLPVAFDEGAHGRDPREEEPWFRELPAGERDRLHAAWTDRRLQQVAANPAQRRNQNRRFAAAVLTFVMVVVAGSGASWVATLGAGIGCGLWWRRSSPDRYIDPLVAVGCLFAAQLFAAAFHGTGLHPMLFLDVLLVVAVAALVGFDGEIRRTGGFDVQ